MKSSHEVLKKRGYVDESLIHNYEHLAFDDLKMMLNAKNPFERTVGVRLLGRNHDINPLDRSDILLELLKKEKSLYTKIEICNVLEKCGKRTAEKMTALLGRIGNNQYRSLPETVSKKVSYPLPRDIIARTLGRMEVEVLPELLQVLAQADIYAIREVIDAIGYMCFYNDISNESLVIECLMKCYNSYKQDKIIRWKIVMACSALKSDGINSFLKIIVDADQEALIRNEAERSLRLKGVKNMDNIM